MRFLLLLTLFVSACTQNPKFQPDILLSDKPEETITVYGDVSMGLFSSVNEKCKVISHAKITIITPPEHGILRASLQKGEVIFNKNHAFAHCNNTKIIGRMVEYNREKGNMNPVYFSYLMTFKNGETRVKSYIGLPKGP